MQTDCARLVLGHAPLAAVQQTVQNPRNQWESEQLLVTSGFYNPPFVRSGSWGQGVLFTVAQA